MSKYINKALSLLIYKMQKDFKFPTKWDEFINKESKSHNLLIKHVGKCYCTHCHLEFKSSKKINNYDICPYCKQKLLIKNFNLMYFTFEKNLTLLDKVDNQIVIRLFELKSIYNFQTKQFKHDVVEYGRIIVGKNWYLLNERASIFMYSFKIHHNLQEGKWRRYDSYYSLDSRGNIYPYNIRKVLKGTIYQYSMLWDFVKKIKGCDLENLLTGVA